MTCIQAQHLNCIVTIDGMELDVRNDASSLLMRATEESITWLIGAIIEDLRKEAANGLEPPDILETPKKTYANSTSGSGSGIDADVCTAFQDAHANSKLTKHQQAQNN